MASKSGSAKTGSTKTSPAKASPPARTGWVSFLRQVRAEMVKVTWPSRRETGVSTVMVLVMVLLACVFFFLSDWVIATFVRTLIGFLTGIFR